MMVDRTVEKGQLQYDMERNTVQLIGKGNRPRLYTARQLFSIRFYVPTTNRYRIMYALPYVLPNTYEAPILFELLCEGEITLLSREVFRYEVRGSAFYAYNTLVLSHDYFVLDEQGNITAVENRKKNWMSLMADHSEAVYTFIKTHKLNFFTESNIIRIITFYNSLYEK